MYVNNLLFYFSNVKSTVSKAPIKEELKTLYLSEKAQEKVIDTLKYIHGPVSAKQLQNVLLSLFAFRILYSQMLRNMRTVTIDFSKNIGKSVVILLLREQPITHKSKIHLKRRQKN